MADDIKPGSELDTAARTLLGAAHAYWDMLRRQDESRPNAVIWVEDTSGRLLVFSRGEYRQQLLRNIDPKSHEQMFMHEVEHPDFPRDE